MIPTNSKKKRFPKCWDMFFLKWFVFLVFAKNFDNLYISIDIDVIDPAFAPGTGYIEPAGLTSREFLYFLHRLKNLKNIRGYDIVEINPKKDINNLTTKLGAKILVELN